MLKIGEAIKDELECPYCGSLDILEYGLKNCLVHTFVSCRHCGRNFEAKEVKIDDIVKYSIINGNAKHK